MNILDFAKMLAETTGCDVKGFQSFAERPEEKHKMEEILTHDGAVLNTEQFLTGTVKPAGLVIAYLDHETEQTLLFEMNEEVSANWRERVK
jgi:hypothetical protein